MKSLSSSVPAGEPCVVFRFPKLPGDPVVEYVAATELERKQPELALQVHFLDILGDAWTKAKQIETVIFHRSPGGTAWHPPRKLIPANKDACVRATITLLCNAPI